MPETLETLHHTVYLPDNSYVEVDTFQNEEGSFDTVITSDDPDIDGRIMANTPDDSSAMRVHESVCEKLTSGVTKL